MNVQRLIIAAVSLSVSLALPGVGLAQEKDAPIILGNVEGNCVTSPSTNTTGATAGDWTITCGDITPGSGLTVIAPPTAVNTAPPPEMAPAPAPDPSPVTTTDTTATDTAVATASDLDADNLADELEWELGLDPSNADTDGDGVADGDEPTLYGTDPTLYDTDGDGLSDGEELFGIFTDPLVWNDPSAGTSTQAPTQEVISDPVEAFEQQSNVATLDQQPVGTITATDGNAAALGPGSASAAPGNVTRGGVSGTSLLGPDGTYSVTEISPSDVTVGGTSEPAPVYDPVYEPAAEPVYEPAPEPVYEPAPETVDPVAADTTVASASDLDGDNYTDTQELELGLDPGNPDTDGDGVADGDELPIYGTDPFTWDSDGDGLSDGEELFGLLTNPLVWDTDSGAVSEGEELLT